MTPERRRELDSLYPVHATAETQYLSPLNFTIDEWIYIRRGWGSPTLDRAYWNHLYQERETSAAAQSYKEAQVPDPILQR